MVLIRVTPIPSLIEFATPSITIGATAAAGDATTAIRSNSTIQGVALITSIDNQIARFAGTGGQLQGYTSGGPTVSDTGQMLKPGQPAYFAYLSSTQSNVTGDGTMAQVNFNAEIYDQTNNFASYAFTAPITGKYLLTTSIYLDGRNTSATQTAIQIATSNRTYYRQDSLGSGTSSFGIQMTTIADMDSSDTATVSCMVAGVSSKTVDFLGDSTDMRSYFAGVLLV
jgi:hypothetical protein